MDVCSSLPGTSIVCFFQEEKFSNSFYIAVLLSVERKGKSVKTFLKI